MMTLNLTDSEAETLRLYLQTNPCSAECLCHYKTIDCSDVDNDGEYKCKIMRDTESLEEKLGL